jgi:ABC-type spermidine/putrescine transport system permease subunit II
MKNLWQRSWFVLAILMVIFLLAPMLLLAIFAFTNRGIANFPIESLSLRWWVEMAQHPQFGISFRNSMIIGLSTAVISAIVGTMAAMGLMALPCERASLVMSVLDHRRHLSRRFRLHLLQDAG